MTLDVVVERTGLSESETQEARTFFEQWFLRRASAVRGHVPNHQRQTLTVEDVDLVMRRLRLFVPVRFIWALVLEIDENLDGEVELEEFLMMVAKLRGRIPLSAEFYRRSLPGSLKDRCTKVFRILDTHKVGLDEDGVCKAIKQLNPQMNTEDDRFRQYIEDVRELCDAKGNFMLNDFLVLQSKLRAQPTEISAALACLTELEIERFTEAFQAWKEAGSTSTSDLRAALSKLGFPTGVAQVKAAVQQLGLEGIKSIQLDHFLYILVNSGAGTSEKKRRILKPGASYDYAFKMGFPLEELWDFGYNDLEKFRQAGFSANVLLKQSYAQPFQLRQAGYSAGELRKIGCTAKQLKVGGFSLEELRNAGFSSEVLKECCSDLTKQRAQCQYEGGGLTLGPIMEGEAGKMSASHGEHRWWSTPRIQEMLDGPRCLNGARGAPLGPRARTAP